MIRRDFLKRLAVLTGSVAFGVATHNSDEDWLISDANVEELGVPRDYWKEGYTEGFHSYREGNINLVIYHSDDFRNRWMKAHRHCVIERPRDKARRVKIFRHYLYGEFLT